MSPHTYLLIAAMTCGVGLSAQAADLTDLPPDQQRTATCMLGVVAKEPGVTDARLRFDGSARPFWRRATVHVFLDFTAHYQAGYPRHLVESKADFDITDLVRTRRGTWGVSELPAYSVDTDWDRACGMNVIGVFM